MVRDVIDSYQADGGLTIYFWHIIGDSSGNRFDRPNASTRMSAVLQGADSLNCSSCGRGGRSAECFGANLQRRVDARLPSLQSHQRLRACQSGESSLKILETAFESSECEALWFVVVARCVHTALYSLVPTIVYSLAICLNVTLFGSPTSRGALLVGQQFPVVGPPLHPLPAPKWISDAKQRIRTVHTRIVNLRRRQIAVQYSSPNTVIAFAVLIPASNLASTLPILLCGSVQQTWFQCK